MMKNFFKIFIFITLLSSGYGQSDAGVANNVIIKKTLSEDWYLISRNLLTTRNGVDEVFFGYLDLNVGRKLGRFVGGNWSWEVGYRHAWLRVSDFWRDEYRPSSGIIYQTKLFDWTLTNRNRLEYRRFESDLAPDRFRYRNETRIIAPYEFTSWKIRWYVEEEWFYELTDDGFNFNWLSTGFRWRVKDGVVAKLGYRWQAQKFGEDWSHRHQLVTGILFFF